MTALLAAVGVALLLVPGLVRFRAQGLHPAEWSRAGSFALRLGHRSVQAALALGSAPTVLHALGVEHVATACHQMFGPVAPGGAGVGWAAAAMLTWTLVEDRRMRRRVRLGFVRAEIDPWLGDHERVDGLDLVTLPTDALLAYAVPTTAGGQIVVSRGLIDQLDREELAAVVAHERSHLRHRHHRHLELLAIVESTYRWLPGIRATADRLRLALERWADEEAAGTPRQRRHVRSALTKTAELLLAPAMAFTGCTVMERIYALDGATPRPSLRTRALALAPIGLAAVALTATAGAWVAITHHGLVGIVGLCPA